jgi:hypothetical protein
VKSLNAGQVRHRKIQEKHIGMELLDLFYGERAILCFANHLKLPAR